MNMDIKLGQGIGEVKFGMTRAEVVSIMGEPSEKEVLPPFDGELGGSEAWHYDTIELSASYDEEEGFKLCSLAASSTDSLFEGIDLIGLSQEEVLQQIEILGLGDVEIETIANEEGEEQIVASIPEVSLNLWFEDGHLSEIQWGPFWDEEEEEYIWPE